MKKYRVIGKNLNSLLEKVSDKLKVPLEKIGHEIVEEKMGKVTLNVWIKAKKKVRYLPLNDFRKLVAVIDDTEFLDFCMFSAYTGLRSGEIIRLQWSDIDDPSGFIRIRSEQKNKEDS